LKKIAVGQEVIIVATGETARVTEYFDDTWIIVRAGKKELHLSRKEIQQVDDVNETIKDEQVVQTDKSPVYAIKGIALVFKQVKKLGGETHYFEVHMVNHTRHQLLFDYKFFLDGVQQYGFKKDIPQHGDVLLHEIKTDQLNDHPLFHAAFWLKKTEHPLRDHFEKEIRLRPKQFFSKTASPQFIADGYFAVELFAEIPAEQETIQPVLEDKNTGEDIDTPNEIIAKAHMPDFIDLHAEKLIPGYEQMSATEILDMQLRAFRQFLETAIRFRLHKIYAVHGIGKGILKNEIAKLLEAYPGVDSFNNHYHTRFGHGATEIWLV